MPTAAIMPTSTPSASATLTLGHITTVTGNLTLYATITSIGAEATYTGDEQHKQQCYCPIPSSCNIHLVWWTPDCKRVWGANSGRKLYKSDWEYYLRYSSDFCGPRWNKWHQSTDREGYHSPRYLLHWRGHYLLCLKIR